MVRTKAIAKRREQARREEASSSNTSNSRSGSESEKETTMDVEPSEQRQDAEPSEQMQDAEPSQLEREATKDNAEALEGQLMQDGEASEPEKEATKDGEAIETQPMQPNRFFYKRSEYNNICKIQTRCDLPSFLNLMDDGTFKAEKEWFENHPQWKHIFHMENGGNHKLQGLYMMLLRTVHVDRRS